MRFSASAPGKAVLTGEYAVLEGAPAIAMAIDCRARVTVQSADGDTHRVVSPGLSAEATFRSRNGTIEWLDESRRHSAQTLLEHVWSTLKPRPRQALSLTLDTRRFVDPESSLKLGFGSSSALAVALTAVLARAAATSARHTSTRHLYEAATTAHRAFQGGAGSGIDVAAATYGGIIVFGLRPERVHALKWPTKVRFQIFWSGRPASTAERLRKLERFEPNRASRAASANLAQAARAVLHAWQQEQANPLLESLRSYTMALRRFSREHGLGVFDAGHQEMCEIADQAGFVYKPCGAGGGDIGIVFLPASTGEKSLARFAGQAGGLGFRRLDRVMEADGLIYEH